MSAAAGSASASASAPASGDIISDLYSASAKLSAATASGDAARIAAEAPAFRFLIDSVRSSGKLMAVKQLCADNIPSFLHFYASSYGAAALEAQIDLLEDDEAAVRIYAIRGLERICKFTPAYTARIADMLAQLLVTDEPQESSAVRAVFTALFNVDAGACLRALLHHVKDAGTGAGAQASSSASSSSSSSSGGGADSALRQRALEFFLSSVKRIPKEAIQQQAASLAPLLAEILGSASARALGESEFDALFTLLVQGRVQARQERAAEQKKLKTESGAMEAQATDAATAQAERAAAREADQAAKKAELDAFNGELSQILQAWSGILQSPLDVSEGALKRFRSAVQRAKPYSVRNGLDLQPFAAAFFERFVPALQTAGADKTKPAVLAASDAIDIALRSKGVSGYLRRAFDLLRHYLPARAAAPAADGKAEAGAAAAAAPAAAVASAAAPVLSAEQYELLSALLSLFHSSAAKADLSSLRSIAGFVTYTGQPGDTASAEEDARREDLLARLTLLLRSAAAYQATVKTAQTALQAQSKAAKQTQSKEERKEGEKKQEELEEMQRRLQRIGQMCKALLEKPPRFLPAQKPKGKPETGKANGKGKDKGNGKANGKGDGKKGAGTQQKQQQQQGAGAGSKKKKNSGGGGGAPASSSSSSARALVRICCRCGADTLKRKAVTFPLHRQ